jgi:hypothetical protein
MYRTGVLAAAISMALASPSVAANWEFEREVESGKTTKMYNYKNYDKDCRERGGVVKVVVHPEHGRLSQRRVANPVLTNRLNPNDRCIGKVLPGLHVEYTSARGFHGVDRFVIERTLSNGRLDVDTFVVRVH